MFRYPKTNIHARLSGDVIEIAYRYDGDVHRFHRSLRADAARQVRIMAGTAADDETIERFIDHVVANS